MAPKGDTWLLQRGEKSFVVKRCTSKQSQERVKRKRSKTQKAKEDRRKMSKPEKNQE